MGFHISLGSFSRGRTSGGAMMLCRVESVAGRVDCQLSLTEKVTKEEDWEEDILSMEEEERSWKKLRSR